MALFANFTWCTFYDGSNCSYNATLYDNDEDNVTLDEISGPDSEYAHFRDMSRFWVKRLLYPLIMCVGVIGNGITIVILTRRRMRSSTNHYLTALAFSDLFYLIFVFTLNLDHYGSMHSYAYYSYWRYALMLTDACSNTSVWLTVTFTIERYVAVCHPIRGKVFCTRSRAKKVIWMVFCLCFLVVLPTPFEWTVVEETKGDNTTRFKAEPSDLGNDETFRQVYYRFTSVVFIFLPLFLLAVFNSFLIRSVHQSKTQRRRMTMRGHRNDHAHQENRITIMLIAVVIMFLLCQLPTASILVYTSIHTLDHNSNAQAVVLGLGNIFNCLVAINAACNFILYCAFSDKYRRTFLRTFIPCMYRLGSPNHSQSNVNTAYTQVEIDSIGGSFRRGRSSRRSTARRNSTSPRIHATGKPHANGNGRANGVHQNGAATKPHYLQVPPIDNGLCVANDDSVGSDSTLDTTISSNELTVIPAANGKSTTVTYHCDSNRCSMPTDQCRVNAQSRNSSNRLKSEHVISLTSPDGKDHLL